MQRQKLLPYNPYLKKFASELRKHSTLAEVALWVNLKKKQLLGYDFHRQRPIDKYIVDFYCPRLMLVIEIDGYSHIEKYKCDMKRQEDLERLGIHFLRFEERYVRKNIEGVLEVIKEWIIEHQ